MAARCLAPFFKTVLPIPVPPILAVVLLSFTLAMQEFVCALTFISSSDQKPVTLGVVTDLVRGDVLYWGELMAAALIASVPVAIAHHLFLDRFTAGITGGAVKVVPRPRGNLPSERGTAAGSPAWPGLSSPYALGSPGESG
jgi:ABC-type glycerol-3-phosphate transport system permease component